MGVGVMNVANHLAVHD